MNKTEIITKVTRAFGKVSLELKKHAPEILVTAGVGGTIASAVLACNATTKVDEILNETKKNVNAVHTCVETKAIIPDTQEVYTEQDAKKDLAIIYAQSGVKLAKLYGPAITLGVLSITCIFASNNILRKRNVALAAAYATVNKGFKEYRSRVVNRFGQEVDKELRYNVKAREVEETVADKNGNEKTVKKTVKVADINEPSDYARFYDDGCTGWTKDADLNLSFLKAQQQYANDKLIANGHLFLNEVYDALGIPRSKAGQVVGWVYDPSNSETDNYVDFGLYDASKEKTRDFVNGYERTILLDFNVDGPILDTF